MAGRRKFSSKAQFPASQYSDTLLGSSGLLIYSQYLDQRSLNYPQFPTGALFARTWDEVIAQLRARHKDGARVAVYPYCAIQHIEAGLDDTA